MVLILNYLKQNKENRVSNKLLISVFLLRCFGLFGKPVTELSYRVLSMPLVSDDDTAAGVAFRNLLQEFTNKRFTSVISRT